MKQITITINIEDELVKTRYDASKVVHMIALDIHQGCTGGFILNERTGNESSRWEMNVAKDK